MTTITQKPTQSEPKNAPVTIDAAGVYYRDLNARLRDIVTGGTTDIVLTNVHGQRYIGTDLNRVVNITINGTPGNDLGAFMNGPRITVNGNAQDGCGNTMDEGQIIVHGHAGDTAGLAARGGAIYIRDDVGYRAGIHMKEYQEKKPALVIGGSAQDFCGEYMAGGVLILLGLNLGRDMKHRMKYLGTGMHGGVIYLRGTVDDYQLGKEVGVAGLEQNDYDVLRKHVAAYTAHFGGDADKILEHPVMKLFPKYLRPYGRLYAY